MTCKQRFRHVNATNCNLNIIFFIKLVRSEEKTLKTKIRTVKVFKFLNLKPRFLKPTSTAAGPTAYSRRP